MGKGRKSTKLEEFEKRFKDVTLTLYKHKLEMQQIKNKVSRLNISNMEKNKLIEDLNGLHPKKREKILEKIVNQSPQNVRKIKIDGLISEFENLERSEKWEGALEKLELILELAEIEGYQIIFNKLLSKYQKIRAQIGENNS
ncbi:MAG: hypothetical protein EU549_01995 [Promethearchaeota archaeon]|nr:MAG: hypothetical protein EU549_01995 [Candidatus Lokiarchaeota archaeon]